MNNKLKLYTTVLNEEIEWLRKNISYYCSFLSTSSRLYKYSFKDQVLIHAQRPDASACADYALQQELLFPTA